MEYRELYKEMEKKKSGLEDVIINTLGKIRKLTNENYNDIDSIKFMNIADELSNFIYEETKKVLIDKE